MPKPKFDRVKLNQLVRAGKSQREIAQYFKVSDAAVSRARKELNLDVVKNLSLENAHRVVDKNINAIEQLQKINNAANEILDLVMCWMRGDKEALQVLEEKGLANRDHREVALKAMAEIRGQLKLQLEIFQALYDVSAVAEFQKEVLTAIGEASPDVRDQIIRNLQKTRAIRATLKFD